LLLCVRHVCGWAWAGGVDSGQLASLLRCSCRKFALSRYSPGSLGCARLLLCVVVAAVLQLCVLGAPRSPAKTCMQEWTASHRCVGTQGKSKHELASHMCVCGGGAGSVQQHWFEEAPAVVCVSLQAQRAIPSGEEFMPVGCMSARTHQTCS
jgi:hypothetical protein